MVNALFCQFARQQGVRQIIPWVWHNQHHRLARLARSLPKQWSLRPVRLAGYGFPQQVSGAPSPLGSP